MNKIIFELVTNGIPVTMEYDTEHGCIKYVISGFYKSDKVSLFETDNLVETTALCKAPLIAISRYDEKTAIGCLQDIVALNYSWWRTTVNKFSGWNSPDTLWIPLLLRFGFIKELVETTRAYSPLKE